MKFRALATVSALLLIAATGANADPSITDNGDGTFTFFDDFNDREYPSDYSSIVFKDHSTTGSGDGGDIMLVNSGVWQINAGGTGSGSFGALLTAYDLGAGETSADAIWNACDESTISVSYDINVVSDATVTGQSFYVGPNKYASTSQGAGIRLTWDDTNGAWDIYAHIQGSGSANTILWDAAVEPVITAGESINVTISDIDCAGAKALVTVTWNGTTRFTNVDATGAWSDTQASTFSMGFTDSAAGGSVSSDNFAIRTPNQAALEIPDNERLAWCPDPGLQDFGYNYRSGVSFVSDTNVDRDLDTAFRFRGDANEEAFAVKVWDHETYSQDFHMTIEASIEGESSSFQIYFLSEDPTPYLTGETLDASAVGNGQSTALLDRARIVSFIETGNDWRISFHVTNGGSYTNAIGPVWTGGSPNAATSFTIRNQVEATGGNDVMQVYNRDGVLLNEAILSDFGNITGMALVGQSEDDFFFADTWVNDNDGTHDSSCIFYNDLTEDQGNFIGSEGSLPNSRGGEASGDEPAAGPSVIGGGGAFDPTPAAEASGLPADAMAWFFGFLFVALVTAGMASIKPVLLVPGLLMGLGGAVAFSYFPLWLPIFMVLIAATLVVFRIRSGAGAA